LQFLGITRTDIIKIWQDEETQGHLLVLKKAEEVFGICICLLEENVKKTKKFTVIGLQVWRICLNMDYLTIEEIKLQYTHLLALKNVTKCCLTDCDMVSWRINSTKMSNK
jgi:hypothetical protein